MHAHLAWNEGAACTREVHYVEARCAIPPVTRDISLVFNDQTMPIAVPSRAVQAPCIGELDSIDRVD